MAIVDSHCHLADEAFAADLDAVVAARRRRPASTRRALHPVGRRAGGGRRARRRARPRGRRSRSPPAIHPHRAGAYAGRAADAAAATRARRPRPTARSRSARSASTTTTTSRRATSSARSSPRRSRSRWSSTSRSSSTRARRPTTRSPSCARPAQGRVRGVMHCFSGTPDEARLALDLGFFISLAGILTFPKADEPARRRAVRPARSAAGRNRRAVSRARAASRQAQRAGLGRRRRSRRWPPSRRRPPRRWPIRSPRTSLRLRDRLRERSNCFARQNDRVALTPRRTYGLIPAGFVNGEPAGETAPRESAHRVGPGSRADFRARSRRTGARRARVRAPSRVTRRADSRRWASTSR